MSNHLIPPDQNIAYKKTLEYLKRYHPDPLGFTEYTGSSGSDKIYPRQNNTQIALLIQIVEKLDYLDVKLKLLESKTIRLEERLNL